jgi:hypothetical protein
MKFTFPIFIGLAATFIAGLILFPFVFLVFDIFFELHIFSEPPPGAWVNDLIIFISLVLWFLLASIAGGAVCTIAAKQKEDFAVFLLIVITFTISYLVSNGEIVNGAIWEMIAFFSSFTIGYITGGFIGIWYKKRRPKTFLSKLIASLNDA